MLKRGHDTYTPKITKQFSYISVQLLRELPDVLLQLGRVHLFFFKAVDVQGHQLKKPQQQSEPKENIRSRQWPLKNKNINFIQRLENSKQ